VQREPSRQVQHHTHDGGRDCAESAAFSAWLLRSASTYGAPRKIHKKHGANVTVVRPITAALLPQPRLVNRMHGRVRTGFVLSAIHQTSENTPLRDGQLPRRFSHLSRPRSSDVIENFVIE
jgi:hypothetical protein